jgi:hypothetical protein
VASLLIWSETCSLRLSKMVVVVVGEMELNISQSQRGFRLPPTFK